MTQLDRRLRELSARLAAFAAHEDFGDSADYAFGAVYALAMAEKCGYQDRPGSLPQEYWDEMKQRCLHASKGKLPRPGRWLGGWYFNSALQRIAAAREKFQGAAKRRQRTLQRSVATQPEHVYSTPALKAVSEEVKRLKHPRPSSIVHHRDVTLEQAVEALVDLVAIMERCQSALARIPSARTV